MALPAPSILSATSRHLSALINSEVSGRPKVSIGSPSEAEPKATDTDPSVNLFMYRFEPSGFHPDITHQDAWPIRAHLLITAYATTVAEDDADAGSAVSGGEINLRLLGSILQLFHEHPVQDIRLARENPVSHQEEEIRTTLQIVFTSITTEEINQIWSTQGDVAYRPSIAYELALMPITPWLPRAEAGPVTSLALVAGPLAATTPLDGVPPEGGDAAGAARLNRISPAELARIEAAKASPPELGPMLAFAGVEGIRREIGGWTIDPSAFETEVPEVEVSFTPQPDLTNHALHVFERVGSAWRAYRTETVAGPAAGEHSTTIPLAVPQRYGEWTIYVDSDLAAEGGRVETQRSNALTLGVVPATPSGGGG